MNIDSILWLLEVVLIAEFAVGVVAVMVGYGRKDSRLMGFGVANLVAGLYTSMYTIPAAGVTISAFSTVAVAIIALWQINENRKLKKRDTQERQLRDMLDWIVQIKNCGLTNIPGCLPLTKEGEKAVEAYIKYNTSIDYAKALTKGEMVRSIVLVSFKSDLLEDFNSVVDSLVAITFLYAGVKEGLHGDYKTVIERIEERIRNKEEREALLSEYAKNLALSTNGLSEEVFGLISKI